MKGYVTVRQSIVRKVCLGRQPFEMHVTVGSLALVCLIKSTSYLPERKEPVEVLDMWIMAD